MHPAVTAVACKDDYILSIVFDNGESGLLDMKPYLDFGVFKKIQDPSMFKTVHVSFDTIAWQSGADLDPEFVYAKCLKNSTAQQGTPPADG
jgi:hypothetical protein